MRKATRSRATVNDRRWRTALTVLSLVGLGISVYLWSAKAGSSEFICGAYGDCVSVNTSSYSEIAGIPVAAAGALMYAGLFGLALFARGGLETGVVWAGFTLSFAGALFSLYLTGVEAFVLRAYCIWCLTSWVIITVIAVMWGRRLSMVSESPRRLHMPRG